jgi:hypothetical protein
LDDERTVALREACDRYVDWYRLEANRGGAASDEAG